MSVSIEQIENNGVLDAPGVQRELRKLGRVFPVGAGQIQNAITSRLFPEAPVTSLPSSPSNGQIVAFQNAAMATAGVVWMLRYNAASGSSFKWEFVGGGALSATSFTANDTASNVFQTAGTPSITVPLGGQYELGFGMETQNQVAALNGLEVALFVSGSQGATLAFVSRDQFDQAETERLYSPVDLAASAVLNPRYRSSSSQLGSFRNKTVLIRPLRVG